MRLLSLSSLLFTLLVILGAASCVQAELPQLCETWKSSYQGKDAEGEHVIALWQFDAKKPTSDASGNGHDLVFVGAKAVEVGRLGGGLETACGYPVEDKPHQAQTKDHDALSPKGAFSVEMWIMPKEELNKDYPEAFLLDKMYVSHSDYQLILSRENNVGKRYLKMNLGFGAESKSFNSRPLLLEVGKWMHIAFVYNGEGGGSFFVNGLPWGSQTYATFKSISPGNYCLVIGDRVGSYFHGFPGLIDQVRICRGAREFCSAKVDLLSDRRCFVRMEPDVSLRLAVTNLERDILAKAKLVVSLAGPLSEVPSETANDGMPTGSEARVIDLPDLPSGKSFEVDYTLDTSLRPGDYTLVTRLEIDEEETMPELRLPISIAPRQTPDRFPVLMWGIPGGISKEMDRLKRMGFTHGLGLGADLPKIWAAGEPIPANTPEQIAKNKAMLDEALRRGFTVVSSLSPLRVKRGDPHFWRVGRDGKPLSENEKQHDVCPFFPELQEFSRNTGISMAQTYGHFPAFGAALAHTEVRDAARPCFHEHDRQAFKKATGLDIPDEVKSPRGVPYSVVKDFPADRVIDDDHPIYRYYQWYWKEGDGWNQANSELTRGLKSTGRDDFWVFHDPAVRVASVYGSGGEVDVISQWTYSYPDPIRIGIATDELLAMAGGASTKQKVMKMTQIIWYRNQTAPMPQEGKKSPIYKASWEMKEPDAPFITIAPMHLREAFWTKIARPISGIMYHGYQSLVPCGSEHGYRFTNEQTQHELARLTHEVVQPLGPTLLNVPGVKSDVALLESFASQVFAQRGSYGWCGHWSGDAHLVAQYAHLQPEIVYDETIVNLGLDGYRVLIMPHCDVITKKMLAEIKKFQARGGVVVGDETTPLAIKPDIMLKSYKRTGQADKDKAALVALAKELRSKLDAKYSRYVDTSNPDVIPYRRKFKSSDYVFFVNDHREFGQYVGHHGLVMENGCPSSAVVSVQRDKSFVYDLVEHRAISSTQKEGVTTFDVELAPCDGRLFMICDKPIQAVQVVVPELAKRGGKVHCEVAVVDADGKPLEAVVPLAVTIRDSGGQKAEFSGYWAAVDGRAVMDLDIAPNDPFGVWQIEVRDLASGKMVRRYFRVEGPKIWPPEGNNSEKSSFNPVQPRG